MANQNKDKEVAQAYLPENEGQKAQAEKVEGEAKAAAPKKMPRKKKKAAQKAPAKPKQEEPEKAAAEEQDGDVLVVENESKAPAKKTGAKATPPKTPKEEKPQADGDVQKEERPASDAQVLAAEEKPEPETAAELKKLEPEKPEQAAEEPVNEPPVAGETEEAQDKTPEAAEPVQPSKLAVWAGQAGAFIKQKAAQAKQAVQGLGKKEETGKPDVEATVEAAGKAPAAKAETAEADMPEAKEAAQGKTAEIEKKAEALVEEPAAEAAQAPVAEETEKGGVAKEKAEAGEAEQTPAKEPEATKQMPALKTKTGKGKETKEEKGEAESGGEDEPGATKVVPAQKGEEGEDGKPELKVAKGSGQGRRSRKKSVFGRMMVSALKALFVLACLAVIAVSIAAVAMVNYMVEATANDDEILDLENIKLNQTSYFMALDPDNPRAEEEEDWEIYQELVGPEHRVWVSLDQVPQHLVDAVIAIEDRNFENHHGVDLVRTVYAFANEFLDLSSSQFGASTIEQQLVKNITGDRAVDGESGYQRKMREMYRAWTLDQRYSKEMIMEAYLNTISLSGTIGGVQAGALDYFDKNVSELTLAECAMIAGITRAPGAYDPYVNPDNCLWRRNSVLAQMLETEKITQEEYDEAVAQPLGLARKSSRSQLEAGGTVFSYFSDQVFEDVVNDLVSQLGYTRNDAIVYLFTGGLRVHTTVDLSVQEPLEDMYANGYNDEDGFFATMRDPRSGRLYKDRLTVIEEDAEGNETEVLPQSATAIIDYDGALRGVVGGIGEKTESRVLNRATQSVRQVGSTMKPIAAYALGIDTGYISYSSLIVDSGVRYRSGAATGAVDPETGEAQYNWPRNFSGTYRNTGMPVVSAIAESTNTVAVKVGMMVGIPEMYDFLVNTLQISSLVGEGERNDMDVAPLVLGSMTNGITAYELAGAYMMFGNGGVYNTLHSYTEVLDRYGNVVVKPQRTSVQAISEETAFVMNRLLYAVTHNGVAPGVSATAGGMSPEGPMECVGKTGTTSEDKDRWFVGLTPKYVTAVWWGYDDNYGLNWSPGARGNIPPNVFKSIMTTVQADMEPEEFPAMPDGIKVAAFCTETGDLAGAGCPGRVTGYYTSERVPPTCMLHGGG